LASRRDTSQMGYQSYAVNRQFLAFPSARCVPNEDSLILWIDKIRFIRSFLRHDTVDQNT
jgi:hypothetical protein